MTTVLTQTALSESDLRQALGLSVDLLSYNPFGAANISTTAARDAEHVAQQLANITRALTGLGQGAGLDARPAFDIASSALNTVLVQHVAQNPNTQMDLWGDATIGAVLTAYRAGLKAAGHSTSVFDAMREEMASAIDIVNQRILAVGNLTSTEARAVFGLPSDLYAQVKAAAIAIENGQANPGLSLDTWAGVTQQLTHNGYTAPTPTPETPAGPAPVLTIIATSEITVQSDIDATLEVTGGGVLGNLVGGIATTLTQQAAITTGTLIARANGQTSAATSQTFTIGTNGNDPLDSTGEGIRVDFVIGGQGNDTISTGGGNDHILGGDGNDIIDGGAGSDYIRAGAGDDIVIADDNDAVVVMGGTGTDTLRIAQNFAPNVIGSHDEFEAAEITVAGLIVDLTSVNLVSNLAGLNIDASGVTTSTITGTTFADTITGGAGADTLTGGLGADTFTLVNVANVKATADNILDFTSTDNIAIQATAAGEFGTLHDSDGDAFAGAATGVVSTVNIAGGKAELATTDANVIAINADVTNLATGYANIGALQTAVAGAAITEVGNAAFADGDELVIAWLNTTDNAYEVGIITIVGGDGFDGADETYEKLLEVDVVGTLTLSEVAASIDFIAYPNSLNTKTNTARQRLSF
ncbi:calcium-binding protein [Yoonia sp. TsM2_T14_4]|uniref:calcium-binding protein n=1 Tax=Yoonia sp. TsM2_T14_4 TaxID=3415141 RepID=UPI003C776AED